MNIDDDLYNDIVKYCELNNKDLATEINKMLKIGFSITKYGNSPFQKMKEQNKSDNISQSNEKIDNKKENIEEISSKTIEKPKKTIRIIKNK